MTQEDKDQLNAEISHIFDSGSNHERIFNMVEMFIDQRYISKSDMCIKLENQLDGIRQWLISEDYDGLVERI